ncbi:hypothetical protein Pcinc_040701, partial [Petrolisthes cinctipes]
RVVFENGTLVVVSASVGDEGVYTCLGRHPNRPNPAAYAATLTLAYLDKKILPTLEPGPTLGNTHVVGVGGRLRVTCLPPPGLPLPHVSWVSTASHPPPPEELSVGAGRVQAEGSELEVEAVRFAHSGNYTCTATNLAGNTSVTLHLAVTRRPRVELVTGPVEVLEEETARLECRVYASPPPYTTVTWSRNNHPLSIDDYRISVSGMEEGVTDGVSVLKVRWARLQDQGLYSCAVHTLGHPPVPTPPVQLSVTERLKFVPLPQDQRIEVGANLTLPCQARGADPPSVTWHRVGGGQLGEVGGDGVESVEGRLEVVGAELRHAGEYLCLATSHQGSINTSISLSVIESPVLEWVTPDPVQVDRGGTLVLECHARGTPKPSIHWDYNHTTHSFDSQRVEVHMNGTLEVNRVRWEDGGVYGCTAGNIGGLVRAEITVTVTGETSKLLGRTVGVAVGGASSYIALVGAMLIYCRQRRQRLKHSPHQTTADGPEAGHHSEEQQQLMYTTQAGVCGQQRLSLGEANTTADITKMVPKPDVPPSRPHLQQLSQTSTHTLATSTHLGLSQASTRTLGGSSASTQRCSSPLHPTSSPPSPQSAVAPCLGKGGLNVRPTEYTLPGAHPQDKPNIQRDDIQVLLTLGHGEFGEVQLGRLKGGTGEDGDGEEAAPDPDKLVMVKAVTTRDEGLLAEVVHEAGMLGGPGHPAVAATLALITSHTPHLLITQYTDWGDLKQFLLATRKESPRPVGSLRPPPLTHPQCLSLALQAAEGLEYLSGRRHTHRDVAARNCLVTSTLKVKLATPCLTRDAYATEYCTFRNQVLPVRWLSPEALLEEEHSMKSSVFSWAWLAWEILTQAAIPHAELTDHQVISAAEQGELRCSAPPRTPTELEELLGACWQMSAKARPPIQSVVASLRSMVTSPPPQW